MNNKDKIISNNDFFKLFNLKSETDYIKEPYIWDENGRDTGFAILKKYPEGTKFRSAKTEAGEDDNLALIKIFLTKETGEQETIPVGVTISNTSFYKLKNNDIWFEDQYNHTDPECPTLHSLSDSKNSVQPIPLEEMSRYRFDPKNNSFIDNQKNKKVFASQILNDIYKLHTETVKNTMKNRWFRFKIKSITYTAKLVNLVGICFLKMTRFLSDKKLNHENYLGLFVDKYEFIDPNKIEDHSDIMQNQSFVHYEKLLRINQPLFFVITFILLILYIRKIFWKTKDFFIIDFFQQNKEDQIFVIIFVLFTVLLFNWFLPNLCLATSNKLIKLHRRLSNKKVRI